MSQPVFIADRIKKYQANADKPFYSVEFSPPKEEAEWPAFFAMAKKLEVLNPLFASVTCGAGGSTQGRTLEIASRLKAEHGMEAMAHITCVHATKSAIAKVLDDLQNAGIYNVLALRGDPPRGEALDFSKGDFPYAEDLVRFTRAHAPGMGIGVAGYPAPHPESPSFASDRAFLAQKVRTGASFVVTQLFFDSREYFALVESLRQAGITVPVIPGVLPVLSLASIRRTLSMCGANIPGKLYLQFEEAHEKGGTEAVREAGIKFAVNQIRELIEGGAPGIHLYTLNRAETCLRIVEEVGL